MFSILKPFLLNLDPEIAHNLAIRSLKLNYLPNKIFKVEDENLLEIDLLGKKFPNPIGLAAGFDKSAEVYNSLLRLGFGFVEVGTVTPLEQIGNPKPRIFRLEDDEALINRLGFNNDGMKVIKERIRLDKKKGILGVNIGPNKNTKDQKEDFCLGLKNFFDIADYITVNISSPNTEGLRDFHNQEKLENLLSSLNKIKKDNETNIPLLLKVSPDIRVDDISEIILKFFESDKVGLYNVVGSSCISRYEFALKLAEKFHLDKNLIKPIPSKQKNQVAPRPENGCLDNSKLENELNFTFSDIDTGIETIYEQSKIRKL